MEREEERRRVQRNVRLPHQLAERVTAYAARLGVSDNTGYILLLTDALGLDDRGEARRGSAA
jgi:hypothetical protein